MKQEDKELLLKDLCARLPHGIIVLYNGGDVRIDEINPFEETATSGFQCFDIEECKPYLRTISSMTKEEYNKYRELEWKGIPLYDWLNENHIDYRGLIYRGLAIRVTKDDNPYEERKE